MNQVKMAAELLFLVTCSHLADLLGKKKVSKAQVIVYQYQYRDKPNQDPLGSPPGLPESLPVLPMLFICNPAITPSISTNPYGIHRIHSSRIHERASNGTTEFQPVPSMVPTESLSGVPVCSLKGHWACPLIHWRI